MNRDRSKPIERFALFAALVFSVASHPRAGAADPPATVGRRHRHGSAAGRDSDRMRRRSRYGHTLDPITRHGRPIRIPLTSSPVAFAPPPAVDAGAVPTRPYDHVVILSIDGLRPDAIDMSDTPNLRMLRAQGGVGTEARTITHSYTLPSHASMLTGVDTDRHGLLHNNFTPRHGFVRVPTVFYYAHDERLATAMFVSKPKLRHIAIPGSVDVFDRPDYACPRVVASAAAYLATAPAGVTFVHLSEPDEYGHSRGWMTEAYLRGVADADRCVGTLLTGIAQRHDLGRVLIIVSADHGGHGRTHGSEREDDMRIPWIVWGSRVARGPYAGPVNTMDTAATALVALGVHLPDGLTGRPVSIALGPAPAPHAAMVAATSERARPASPAIPTPAPSSTVTR
ncbi:MAG: alkaline phosphatase family protein [Deltaproteobacteria bacterium]